MLLDKPLLAHDLATCVRHDLRDPLGAISHWLALLGTPGLDPALRERAVQGIRAGIDEQLEQIVQLADLLEHGDLQVSPVQADPSKGHVGVDLPLLLERVCVSLAPALRARVRLCLSQGTTYSPTYSLVHADASSLERALAALVVHGTKQLLSGEQVCVGLRADAPKGMCRIALGVRSQGEPIQGPWQMLIDPQAIPDLALLHVRHVLSLSCVQLRIVTVTQADDTALLDFPLMDPPDEPCSDR